MREDIFEELGINLYNMDRTVKSFSDVDLTEAENDNFEELKFQAEGILAGKNPTWYSKEYFTRYYYKLLFLRDAMYSHSRKINTPKRNITEIVVRVHDTAIYDFNATLESLSDADLADSEADAFAEFEFQCIGIMNDEEGGWFDDASLKHRYYKLIAIRDLMYNRDLAAPEREITERLIDTLISK